ncbi:MAG: hypothetical protein R3E83_20745 [Burkholderiaceae bacterium]
MKVGDMQDLKYPECIQRLYESEVNGEAIWSALLKAATSERDRYLFATLLQLETETKAWLQPFLYKYRIELSKPDISPFIEQSVATYQSDRLKALQFGQQVTARALAEFEAIAAVGPQADQPYLQGMVRHESAILAWIEGEIADAGDSAIEPVIALLRHPI